MHDDSVRKEMSSGGTVENKIRIAIDGLRWRRKPVSVIRVRGYGLWHQHRHGARTSRDGQDQLEFEESDRKRNPCGFNTWVGAFYRANASQVCTGRRDERHILAVHS